MDSKLVLKRRDIEREKARVALHMPHVVAREAAHIYSTRASERMAALGRLAAGIAADFEKIYAIAFFECIEAWLSIRGYTDAADTAEAFVQQLHPVPPALQRGFEQKKAFNF